MFVHVLEQLCKYIYNTKIKIKQQKKYLINLNCKGNSEYYEKQKWKILLEKKSNKKVSDTYYI